MPDGQAGPFAQGWEGVLDVLQPAHALAQPACGGAMFEPKH